MSSSSCAQPGGLGQLAALPVEILASTFDLLPNSDIKHVRLACAWLRNIAQLRFDRVFLSANPRNIQVCKEIANHETFRQNITEIIYDDARIVPLPKGDPASIEGAGQMYVGTCNLHTGGFSKFGKSSLPHLGDTELVQGGELMSDVAYSRELYQKLLEEQNQVFDTNADMEAFAHALTRFPRLRRITLTLSTHGDPLTPLHQTPMIRNLPPRFIHPIPREWAIPIGTLSGRYFLGEWTRPDVKKQWRGFCFITHLLAECQSSSISELVVDVNQLATGLNCRLFDEPESDEYKNLVSLLRQPSMSRFDLALSIRGQDGSNWSKSRSNHIRDALGEAVNLQHFSLSTNAAVTLVGYGIMSWAAPPVDYIPLHTIFPVQKWSRLRHFGLSRFHVKQGDLLSLIAALPSTLRSIELSFLSFVSLGGSYRHLLFDMKQTLGWAERPVAERPKVTIRVDAGIGPTEHVFIEIISELRDFFYHNGMNPFGEDYGNPIRDGNILPGIGVKRHVCNPAMDRPNLQVPSYPPLLPGPFN